MSNRPFRFLHASDFHLEQAPQGMAEVPEHLKEPLIESAYTAAQRVFETALAEDVELVVLSGDILQPEQTGPRGPLFLAEQFARLAERGIAVYWAGGSVDPPEAWPSAVPLPDNVHVFPRGRIEEVIHRHDGTPVARLLGTSRPGEPPIRNGEFAGDLDGLFSVAAVYGAADAATLRSQGTDYWALGGRHDRATLLSGPQLAHYPGSPQGRRPEESGIHGCTLVYVDEQNQARTSLIPADAMRWLAERIAVDAATSREDLTTRLRERVHTLLEAAPKLDLLVTWMVVGSGPLMSELRRGNLTAELLAWLRDEYGRQRPAAWSLSLEMEHAAALPPEWYEQETIRGDFLRAIRQLELEPGEPLGLETYLAEKHLAGSFTSAVQPGDAAVRTSASSAERQRVLREAALLGVDLLSGEEPQW